MLLADMKRAIALFKKAREENRKRWCSPETVYHRGHRCYVIKPRKLGPA